MLSAAILSAWLQYAADGAPHVRAVVAAAPCPALHVDGRSMPMRVRAARSAGFDDVVCDAAVPAAARDIRVGAQRLPSAARDPQRVVVFADTGCRIALLQTQACDDPDAWPLPKMAAAVAALHPDLIVHVGDYLYRERGCPPLANCRNSPHGDTAAAWTADWLAPAAPMFATAPFVFVRGNHEECRRNGAGWFRYLDARAGTACSEATDPYAVALGGLHLVVFDSAVAEDGGIDPGRAPIYRRQFARVRALAGSAPTRWFVTHRPPYLNADERSAMGDALAAFDLVLSGHIHFFAALNAPSLPPLVVNGEGGTKLDPDYAPLLPLASGDVHVEGDVFGSSHFGFAMYTHDANGWTISLRDPDGTQRAQCTLRARTVHCMATETEKR